MVPASARGARLVPVRPARRGDLGADARERGASDGLGRGDGPGAALPPRGDEPYSPGEHIEHLVRPLSAGVAVPVFALFAAGVTVSPSALREVFTQAMPLGIVLGLLVGKTVGVFGGSWLTARWTRAELNPRLRWADLFAVSVLAGIGFTVSLLISDLAFPDDPVLANRAKAAVLTGSLLCALVATVLLKLRNRHYRRLCEEEELDDAVG
nr:Na+/H+ antiporter NhaA [Kitasatospora acidiphila]